MFENVNFKRYIFLIISLFVAFGCRNSKIEYRDKDFLFSHQINLPSSPKGRGTIDCCFRSIGRWLTEDIAKIEKAKRNSNGYKLIKWDKQKIEIQNDFNIRFRYFETMDECERSRSQLKVDEFYEDRMVGDGFELCKIK